MVAIQNVLSQNIDIGMGVCLQCCAEYSMGLVRAEEVSYAITTAPMQHPIPTPQGIGQVFLPAPTCLKHLNVQKPGTLAGPGAVRLPADVARAARKIALEKTGQLGNNGPQA